jgi:hypothetical protein
MQNLDGISVVLATLLGTVVWVLYKAIYRLTLSPLVHIPGPRLAGLTTLYAAYFDVYLPGQYVFKIKEFHQKYGYSLIVRLSQLIIISLRAHCARRSE